MHHHLGLDLAHCFDYNRNNDQDASSTKDESIDAGHCLNDKWNDGNKTKE